MTPNPAMPLACLCLVLMLTGCSLGSKQDVNQDLTARQDPATEAALLIEEARAEASSGLSGGGLAQLEEVRIPVAEAWLERPFRGLYRELRADLAIRALVRNRPMRLELEVGRTCKIPMVRPDPSARTVREHLDSVVAQANWSWRIDRGVIMIRDIETRRFPLSSQPGEWKSGLGLRNLNETGGSVADNGMELELDPYGNEIAAQVRDVLGLGLEAAAAEPVPAAENPACVPDEIHSGMPDPRTSVNVSPSGNLLTVTARPNAMREVEAQIREFEQAASRVVRISLSLIEVGFDDEKKRNLALDLIRHSSESSIRLFLGNSSQLLLENLSGGSAGTLAEEGGASFTGFYTGEGKHAGSNAVVQWLDTLGDASIAFDKTVEILNNRVASIDLTRTEKYVSKITRDYVEEANQVEIEVELSDLRTGMVVHLQPTARSGGQITVTLGFSRSALIARRPYNFGGNIEGETHVTDDFNELVSISLRDGEPRLLASLSESESRQGRSRVPIFGRFGIPTSGERSFRERDMVMLITATVVGARG